MRERRQKEPLRLTLPPPSDLVQSPLSSPLSGPPLNPSPLSSSSSSPGIDSLSDLEKLSVLGRGNGSKVYKVCHKQTGTVFALKAVPLGDDAIREAEIFRRVDSSEYVVKCIAVFDEDDGGGGGKCFVMEYMDAGSLHDILCKKKRLPEKVISGIVKSVLNGLQYLHGLKVVHRDIKPSNLLVNTKGEVKIADFGVSLTTGLGTCAYMSPERMDPERWDGGRCDGCAGDVWSLGVVAMECYVGRFPLVEPGQKLDWITLMWAICFGENVESVVETASPAFESFCRRCLEREWRRRGTVEELLLHPFVNQCGAMGIEDVASYIALNDD